MGICLSHSSKDILLQLIGGHFSDQAVVKLKEGKVLRGTGDNWDLRILKGQMRKENCNLDLHLFASNLIENRVSFTHLPNDVPKGDISSLSRSKFSLSHIEWAKYRESSKVLVGRIIVEFFPKFNFFKKILPDHIPHVYSQEMKEKSTIISLPIIDANEASYSDCVKILRQYESWIAELYHKAGILDELPEADNPPVPNGPAQAGQTYAHTNFTENDPMKDMKIMFGGDQLTRVRFAGAKDLLKGTHTPTDRLEHCSPFKIGMWHAKASLLQYSYHLLYRSNSIYQQGTLKYFRENYNRKNATPDKVLDSYEGSEELFLNVGRAYIVTALCQFFGMSSLDEKPINHQFPTNIVHASDEIKSEYFYNTLEIFLDIYLLQKVQYVDSSDDFVKNYGLCIVFLTILILQLKDTAKEGDGNRNLINQKILLSVFKSLGQYSKYAVEMFVSISQMECVLTPRLAEEFKWGFFVNWRGGPGHNIEDDLAQEIANKLGKKIVQRMGPNKTVNSISKICKAVSGLKQILENFDDISCTHKSSVQHGKTATLLEEKEMVKELLQLDPFNHTTGRAHDSFPDIKRHPFRYLKAQDFSNWIKKHKMQLSL